MAFSVSMLDCMRADVFAYYTLQCSIEICTNIFLTGRTDFRYSSISSKSKSDPFN